MLKIDQDLIIEIETQIIGILLLKPEKFMECDLTPDDFDVYPQVFQIVKDEYMATESVNVTSVSIKMHDLGYPKYLASEMHSSVISVVNFPDLISLLKGYSIRRHTIRMATEAISLANDVHASHDACLSLLQSISGNLSASDKIISQLDILKDMRDNGVNKECFKTGLGGLDALMGGGLFRGKMYGFSGKAKSGKTLLASTISYNLAEKGHKHLYVCMEMGANEIAQRKFARAGGFNSLEFIQGKRSWKDIKPMPDVVYLDAPGITLDELKTRLLEAVARHKITGAIIDYWQLVQGQNGKQTEEKHLRDVAQSLADFAKTHSIWIFLLSQTNEDGKTFAGQGLIKACDQLYMINGDDDTRWLEMAASRYTEKLDYGSDLSPSLKINKRVGPYFDQI